MYNLTVDGYNDFWYRRVSGKRILRRVPLSGIVDGSNQVFLLPSFPVLSTSYTLYLGASVFNPSYFTMDPDRGVVTVGYGHAPTSQLTADVIQTGLTSEQVILFLYGGFQMIESLWQRGFMLSSDPNTFTLADPSSNAMYVCQTGNPVPIDPPCGPNVFSTSTLERNLLARAAELCYVDAMMFDSSFGDIDVAERVGGVRLNASMRPKNIKVMRDSTYSHFLQAWYGAMDEYYTGAEQYGSFVEPPKSAEYSNIWNWQTDSVGNLVPRLYR